MDPKEIRSVCSKLDKYKKQNTKIIEPYTPYIVKLDGLNFKKFSEGFSKPFDPILRQAMIATTCDLLQEFKPCTGYTYSDKIILIFGNTCSKEEFLDNEYRNSSFPKTTNGNDKFYRTAHNFNGKTEKICSVSAGYASSRFNYHLNKMVVDSMYEEKVCNRVRECNACFDCKIIVFEEGNFDDICDYMVWTSTSNSYKNTLYEYAISYFGYENTYNKDTDELIEMLKDKSIEWDSIPVYEKYGIYVKREKYLAGDSVHNRIACRCFIIKSTNDFIKILLEKKWHDGNKFGIEYT